MFHSVTRDTHTLMQTFDKAQPIEFNEEGLWRPSPQGLVSRITTIFRSRESLLVETAEKLIKEFDRIESQPLIFGGKHPDEQTRINHYSEAAKHLYLNLNRQRQGCFAKMRHALEKAGSALHLCSPNQTQCTLTKLAWRDLSFQYRMASADTPLVLQSHLFSRFANGENSSYLQLLELAKAWKTRQIFFTDHTDLTDMDQYMLQEINRHTVFTELLLHHPELLDQLFKWCLRDNNDPDVFIQYAATTERLTQCFLSKAINRLGTDAGTDALKIEFMYLQSKEAEEKIAGEEGERKSRAASDVNPYSHAAPPAPLRQKVVTLPFEGRRISILDEQQKVTFRRGQWTVPIKKIFDEIAKQNDVVPRFTYFHPSGIENWKADRFGYWDTIPQGETPINLNQARWWEQMPNMEISYKSVQEQYGVDIQDGKALIILAATRETNGPDGKFNIDKAHGYTKVILPGKAGEPCRLYSFGNFLKHWPTKTIGHLVGLGRFNEGTIESPDHNLNYSHRQHENLVYVVDSADAHNYLDGFKEEIQLGRSGNLTFQYAAESCTRRSQERAEKFLKERVDESSRRVFDNIYQMPFTETDGKFKPLLKVVKKFPEKWQPTVLKIIFTLFAPWRVTTVIEHGTKVSKCLMRDKFWQDWVVHIPGRLFENLKSGVIPRVIRVNGS